MPDCANAQVIENHAPAKTSAARMELKSGCHVLLIRVLCFKANIGLQYLLTHEGGGVFREVYPDADGASSIIKQQYDI